MSINLSNKCPRCPSGILLKNDKYSGLVTWTKDTGGNVNVDIGAILPAQAYICNFCGHVELKYQKP